MNKPLKVVIAGGRTFKDWEIFKTIVKDTLAPLDGYTVVSGGAAGADAMAERYAQENDIEVQVVEAEWEKHGKKAGMLRNAVMADMSDILIAFWDGHSKGTKNMLDNGLRLGLEIHLYRY